MLQNAYFLAKIGADTAENEQPFAEILPKTGNYPTGEDREEGREAALVEVAVGAPHDGRAAGAPRRHRVVLCTFFRGLGLLANLICQQNWQIKFLQNFANF